MSLIERENKKQKLNNYYKKNIDATYISHIKR